MSAPTPHAHTLHDLIACGWKWTSANHYAAYHETGGGPILIAFAALDGVYTVHAYDHPSALRAQLTRVVIHHVSLTEALRATETTLYARGVLDRAIRTHALNSIRAAAARGQR